MASSQDNVARKLTEKRSSPRFNINVSCEIVVKGLEEPLVEQTGDISNTGLFLKTTYKPDIGDTIHLRVILKDQDGYFDAKAKVVRVEFENKDDFFPLGFAVEYIDLNEKQQFVIDNFLKDYFNA